MIVRIFTGQDGQTHFEDLPLPTEEIHNVALQAGANLMFRRFPADYFSDWHTRRRYARKYHAADRRLRVRRGT